MKKILYLLTLICSVFQDFLINNDFIRKTIILFRTLSASVFITEDIERLAPNATWLEG